MTALFKPLILLALLLLGVALPELALAEVAKPAGYSDWNLYVYGNGRVVFDILMGIKMLMVPEAGETGFMSLMLVMATIGFIILAVAAGFDPGKNLLKMFSYILVVWMVTFGSTQLTANVVIIDLARGTDGVSASEPQRVSGAPALVVLPAALTSEVGQYFTRVIETYFTMPGEFKLSGQGVGQFNLFGKMMSEATQYVLTSPELKRSLSAYTADCVVPAMALGRLTGPVMGINGAPAFVSGTEALLRTSNMSDTLATAANPAILTKYFPFSKEDKGWTLVAKNEMGTILDTEKDLNRYSSTGVLVSCASAWTMMSVDMQKHAQLLVNAGANAWSKSGVMVPFETAFSSMLAQVAAPGGATGANWSRPQGFILQQAMANSMNGSFRQAAIQTGNNELMQAAALSQAEQQQKSSWTAAFSVFNNMMGYVFTVLQAFIFALTPLIVIALMVPGMGKAIFVNYAQVLIWLTLWQPMLALINFIIVLFATESISVTLSLEGGPSMANKALLSEKTSDLMIAAGFLGTMTPLLSWGIVKGAMAFTEFISKGVGSEFASQAGASAATGNLSMGNLSMDNTSMNKYTTAMSSAVGAQGVAMGLGAGALTGKQDGGGAPTMLNGKQVDMTETAAKMQTEAVSHSKAIGEVLSAIKNGQVSDSQVKSWSKGEGATRAQQQASTHALQRMETNARTNGVTETESKAETAGNGKEVGAEANAKSALTVSLAPNVLGLGAGWTNAEAKSNSQSEKVTEGQQFTGTTAIDKDSKKNSVGGSETEAFNTGKTSQQTKSNSTDLKGDTSSALSRAAGESWTQNEAVTRALSNTASVTSSFSAAGGTDLGMVRDALAGIEATRTEFARGLEASGTRESALQATLVGNRATYGAEVDTRGAKLTAERERAPGGGGLVADERNVGASVQTLRNENETALLAAGNQQAVELAIQKEALDEAKKNTGARDAKHGNTVYVPREVGDKAGVVEKQVSSLLNIFD